MRDKNGITRRIPKGALTEAEKQTVIAFFEGGGNNGVPAIAAATGFAKSKINKVIDDYLQDKNPRKK